MEISPAGSSDSPSPEQCLLWSQGTVMPFPAEATVPAVFAERCREAPGAIAVREGEHACSYAQLQVLAAATARHLREVAGGDPGLVGLPAVHHHAFVVGILGILQAGGAYLPIDESEPEARQQQRREACHTLLRWEETGEGNIHFQATRLREAPPRAEGHPAEAPAYVLYTSGSTGTPKGVIVPHRAITRLVCQTDYLQLRADDVVAFHSNPCFDASTLELWGPLLNGGTLVITSRETVLSARDLGRHLRHYGITTLWLTMSLLAQLAEEDATIFTGLRHLLFGGEAADAAALRRVAAAGRSS